MNEVGKMYENARVEAKRNYYCPECESLLEDWYSGDDYIEYRCTDCEYAVDNRMEELNTLKFIDIYPPFIAEKQLELIKWLAIRFNSDYMSYWHNEIKDIWTFRLNDLTELSSEEPCIYEGKNKDFTESLCNLINDLWQDLTEEERKQIKNILESEVRE